MGELSMVRMGGGRIGSGTYTGNDSSAQFIKLGATPKWVVVWNQYGGQYYGDYFGGLALNGLPCKKPDGTEIVYISTDGFSVFQNATQNIKANAQGLVYYYLYGL